MRFQVPQFIETEVKLIGPFTLKQFLWLASGGSLIFLIMLLFKSTTTIVILSIPTGIIFLSLAFGKIDEIPLFNYLIYIFLFLFDKKRFVFKKEENPGEDIRSINLQK